MIKIIEESGIEYVSDFREITERLCAFLEEMDEENKFLPYFIRIDAKPEKFDDPVPVPDNCGYERLNEFQKNAIWKALSQDVTFIWGPPGTGKTQTLICIALVLFRLGYKVLILSLSNSTVDSMFKKLITQIDAKNYPMYTFIRLGKPRKSVDKTIEPYFSTKLSEDTKIVAANYLNLLSKEHFIKQFDYVIMDEVSMTPIPLLVTGSYFAREAIVLAGDPRQLPPPYPEDIEKPNEFYSKNVFEHIGIGDNTSMDDERVAFLGVQYRMHKNISDLISKLFYDTRLKCGCDIELLKYNNKPFPKSVFLWIYQKK